jgi:phage/plasmid primase-like uncharacterized protein
MSALNHHDFINAFKDFAQSEGITLPKELRADGQLHRFRVTGTNGEKVGGRSGAYTLHVDSKPAGYVQDFRTGTKLNWTYEGSYKSEPISQADIQQRKEQADKEQAKKHSMAARATKIKWNSLNKLASESIKHGYLTKKRINAHHARTTNDSLVVPVQDSMGKLTTMQFIYPNGEKRFLKDGKKKGCYSLLNPMTNPSIIAIAEGFATTASIIEDAYSQAHGIMGVMALDADNLLLVAQTMREQHPQASIIIFGDKGDVKDKGEIKAKEAAKAINGFCVLPPITKGDFNDYLTSDNVTATLEDLILIAGCVPIGTETPPKTDHVNSSIEEQSSHNDILDTEQHYCSVEFLHFVDDTHILKQLALAIAKPTYLPPHTVFLIGLGVFASVACRRWCVEYQHGSILPIGLNVIGEQPSATGKSWAIGTFQKPFYTAEKDVKKAAKTRLGEFNSIDKNELTDTQRIEIETCQKVLKSTLFTTNTTAEALEQSLTHSGGYFSAVSSEQGLFNTILGYCYSDKASNNDLLLNGFDGGYMGSLRVSRDGYFGSVVGGAVMFAQSGGIENLLKASNGTGLAERFLLIAEKHNLGTRDFTQTAIINHDLVEEYNALCEKFATYIIESPVEFNELSRLDICSDGWRCVAEYRNSIEKHLADGGRYSHITIRGAAGKVNMQIMKIASLLHLLDDYQNKSTTIELKHVKSAIGIANAMLEANLKLCQDKGIVGVKAEYTAILSLFENGNKPRTERELIMSRSRVAPFKDFTGSKSELIRATLNDMVADNVLKTLYAPPKEETDKPMKCYLLAQ